MDAMQFAYWLQGFTELNGAAPNAAQWKSIAEHLKTVFTKVTPPVAKPSIDDILRSCAPAIAGWPLINPSNVLTC